MSKKVLVAMSGGVDSSVAALLLKEQGYEVTGATFRLWQPSDESGLGESTCCSASDVNDARMVCGKLGIPHYVFNYKDLFREQVVDRFAAAYEQGRTPNPCIDCNRYIKFEAFLHRAKEQEFDFIATGHYANVSLDPATGRYRLRKGKFDRKDQSYVLYSLTQDQLSHLLLPLSDLPKEEVRAIAEAHGLLVSRKPDSQDICFIPDKDCTRFLETYTGRKGAEGNFVDLRGNVLGRHKGLWSYTIGQRKGLGISFGKPMFVAGIDPESGNITLAEDHELYTGRLIAEDLNWITIPELTAPLEARAKIRYSHRGAPALLTPLEDGTVEVRFHEPQRAITRGQAVVFYDDDDYVIGGGTIR